MRLPSLLLLGLTQRFEQEGTLPRADNATFRWASGAGTGQTVHLRQVERQGDRVRIRAGTGRNEERWSFVPPDGDAPGWATDIRAMIRLADSTSH